MSIQSEIDRIKSKVAETYSIVEVKGGTLPDVMNINNLPNAVDSISGGGGGEGSQYFIAITFDSAFSGRPYTVTGPEEEIHTGTVPASLQETVQVFHGASEYTVTATDASGTEFSLPVLVGSLFGTYDALLLATHVYGVTWDGTETTKWTRTDEAALFTDPVPYVAGATEYGSPFDNSMPWSGMVIEERTAGTMVKIPKFWYQLYQNTEGTPSSGMTIKISNAPLEGFSVSPAHMDRGDGKGERDVVYVGRYHCAASNYKSKTGEKPKASITRSTSRTEIHKLGSNIWQMDFATRFTIWLLYLVEFADWNSQKAIGAGCGNGSSTENMGYTDSMPYHTGTTQSSRGTYGLGTQYRFIEGLWDNVCDLVDGCYNDANGFNIILNPNSFSDSSGGVSIGTPSSGYPTEFTMSNAAGFPMFYASETGRSGTVASCDNWNFNASNPVVYVGGYYDDRSGDCGLFYQGYSGVSDSYGDTGSRAMELPNNA